MKKISQKTLNKINLLERLKVNLKTQQDVVERAIMRGDTRSAASFKDFCVYYEKAIKKLEKELESGKK